MSPARIGRRRFLWGVPGVFVATAGCFGEETSGGFSPDAGSTGEDGEGATPQIGDGVKSLRAGFEDRGLDVLDVSILDGTIEMRIQTGGDVDEDIRRAAGAYATSASRLEDDLLVRVEDRGLTQETFEIKLEWARQFAAERMTSQEYLERINETRRGG